MPMRAHQRGLRHTIIQVLRDLFLAGLGIKVPVRRQPYLGTARHHRSSFRIRQERRVYYKTILHALTTRPEDTKKMTGCTYSQKTKADYDHVHEHVHVNVDVDVVVHVLVDGLLLTQRHAYRELAPTLLSSRKNDNR